MMENIVSCANFLTVEFWWFFVHSRYQSFVGYVLCKFVSQCVACLLMFLIGCCWANIFLITILLCPTICWGLFYGHLSTRSVSTWKEHALCCYMKGSIHVHWILLVDNVFLYPEWFPVQVFYQCQERDPTLQL